MSPSGDGCLADLFLGRQGATAIAYPKFNIRRDIPPNLSPSRVMQLIKGKTSNRLMRDFRTMRKEFWGRHLWARGYFVVTTGNVTDEVIAKYIELQGAVPQDDDSFKVSEW